MGPVRAELMWQSVVDAVEVAGGTAELDILDLGGGTGGDAVRLALLGHRVAVVDPSPDALASLHRRAVDSGPAAAVHGILGDAADLLDHVEPASYDLVICHGVLEHVDDPGAGAGRDRHGAATGRPCQRCRRGAQRGRHGSRARRRLRDRALAPDHECCGLGRTRARSPEIRARRDRALLTAHGFMPGGRPTASGFSPISCPARSSTASQARARRCSSWSGSHGLLMTSPPFPLACSQSRA